MKKTESWSIFDFSTLKNDKIATLLSEHNIPLTVEETKICTCETCEHRWREYQ